MRRSPLAIVPLAAFSLLAGCSVSMTARKVKVQEDLRFRGADDESVADYSPSSKLFRIAVVDFVDQTNNTAGKVEDMFADVMTTALYRTSRFTLYDRSQLKRKNKNDRTETVSLQQGVVQSLGNAQSPSTSQLPASAKVVEEKGRLDDSAQAMAQMETLSKEVDGVFVAFITNAEMPEGTGKGTYTVDYRIVKRIGAGQTTLVIFADSATVHFSGNPMQKDSKPVTLLRTDLEAIAAKVAEFFPKLNAPDYAAAKVTDVNGRMVTISLGSKQVKPGYSFFVTTEPSDQTGEFHYKGNFVVRDAFDKASRAELTIELPDAFMKSIKPGDRVLMK